MFRSAFVWRTLFGPIHREMDDVPSRNGAKFVAGRSPPVCVSEVQGRRVTSGESLWPSLNPPRDVIGPVFLPLTGPWTLDRQTATGAHPSGARNYFYFFSCFFLFALFLFLPIPSSQCFSSCCAYSLERSKHFDHGGMRIWWRGVWAAGIYLLPPLNKTLHLGR